MTGIGNVSRAPVGPVPVYRTKLALCAVRVTSVDYISMVNTCVAREDGRKRLFARSGKLSFDGETAKEKSV